MKQRISFESFDGTQLVGVFQSSQIMKLKGAFVLVHGIPSDKDEWGFYSRMADILEQKGYATFRFDFRDNGESQKRDTKNLTLAQLINDIDAAYNQVRNMLGNQIAIYMVGTSCGGGVTVKWKNVYKREVCKIFLMAPVLDYEYEVYGKRRTSDFSQFRILDTSSKKTILEQGYFDSDIKYGLSILNEARLFDPVDELNKVDCDIIIFQGASDTVVPISITKEILLKVKKDIELYEIPGADHGFAILGDDDLTTAGTKENHIRVYNKMYEEILEDDKK